MRFTKGLKEQAAYIDGELLKLSVDASSPSNTIRVDQAEHRLDTYSKGLQKIAEELKALLKRVYVEREKELLKSRMSAIDIMNQQISDAAELYGATFLDLEEAFPVNRVHLHQNGRDMQGHTEEVDNSFDIDDLHDLLNQSLPKLL